MTAALILAGARNAEEPVARSENKILKAFVEIGGSAMIDHVAQKLSEDTSIKKIYIAIPDINDFEKQAPFCASLLERGEAKLMPVSHSPVSSVLDIWQFIHDETLLITSADHPLLPRSAVDKILNDAKEGISVGFVSAAMVEARFPNVRRTKLSFKDGAYCTSNLFVLKGAQSRQALEFWQKMENSRKKPLSMALKLGFGLLYGYLSKTITLQDTLDKIAQKTNCPVHAVILDDPLAAQDVDRVEDLKLVREIMQKEGAAS